MSTIYVITIFTLIGAAAIVLHKKYNNTFGVVLVSLLLSIGSYFLIDDKIALYVLIGGVIIGYITDFLGVFTNRWKYFTNDSYNYWIGFGWGFVTIMIYQLRSVHWSLLILTSAVALAILFKKKNNLPRSKFEWFFTVLKIILGMMYPSIFILGIALGTIIEYLAVEVFKAWEYSNLSYLIVGIGYSTIIISVVYFSRLLVTGAPLWQGILILVLYLLYIFQYSLDVKHGNLLAPLIARIHK